MPKRPLFFLGFAAALATGATGREADFEPVVLDGHPAHPLQILVKVKIGPSARDHTQAMAQQQATATQAFELLPGLMVLELEPESAATALSAADGTSIPTPKTTGAQRLQERIEALRATGLYEYVEPDYLLRTDALPNDARFADGTLWGLHNSGQNGGTAGVDISAVQAWDVSTGSSSIIVAVIDSGVRHTHEDLSTQLWHNAGEIAGNRIDDDGNGYIDDIWGINAIDGSGHPNDETGHGTHIAGTIGARANGGSGTVGVAWNVRLMALKFLGRDGTGTTSDAIECINYAASAGVRIINASWGSRQYSRALEETIIAAGNMGILIIAAAGNDGSSNDLAPHYPAGYRTENMISVAAHDRNGQRPAFSSYGAHTVDLAAPGVDIFSTSNEDDTGGRTASGTSFAAPHVAGVAALVAARYPGISADDLRARIVATTVETPAWSGLAQSGGRLSAVNALSAMGDGQLEISVSPRSNTRQVFERSVPVVVRVADLTGIAGAAVTGSIAGGAPFLFLDNGVAPDLRANDGFYSARVAMPATGSSAALTVNASAIGKTSASATVHYPLAAGAPNDLFADRADLGKRAQHFWFENTGCSRESGEPRHAGRRGGASVWWTYTAPGDGRVELETSGDIRDTVLAVYTGVRVDQLTEVASNDDLDAYNRTSRVVFAVQKGVAYQIAVDSAEGEQGRIALDFVAVVPPENDRFDDRPTLEGTHVETSGSTRYATREDDEPAHGGSGAGHRSVWYRWAPQETGTARIEGSDGTIISVYTGDTLSSLKAVPGRPVDPPSREVISVTAGTVYQIAVTNESRAAKGEDFIMTLSVTRGPTNDHFVNRPLLSGSRPTASGTSINATLEVGEPLHFGDQTGPSLWWRWTAPASGTCMLMARASDLQPGAAVYTGNQLVSLTGVASGRGGSLEPGTTRLAFQAQAGMEYQIIVEGENDRCDLSLELVNTPVNDNFANRLGLEGDHASLFGTNQGATREPGEPSLRYDASGATLWWQWTSPATGTVRLSNPDPNLLIGVFTGTSLESLSAVPNDDRDGDYLFRATAGTTYQIVMDSLTGRTGTHSVELARRDPPVNDQFADRTPLFGRSIHLQAEIGDGTREPSEPDETIDLVSLWWTWTAPASGMTILETSSAAGVGRPYLWVFAGDTLETLEVVPDPTDEFRKKGPRRVFNAIEGKTYQIAALGGNSRGAFELRMDLVGPPPNDNFSARLTLSGAPVTVTGSNIGATMEPGEPYGVSNYGRTSVWWTWTAPTDGTVQIDSTTSAILTRTNAYTGDTLPSLQLQAESRDTHDGKTLLEFAVLKGTAYQISIEGPGAVMGAIGFSLRLFERGTNDDFAGAQPLSGGIVNLTSTTLGSTGQAGEPRFRSFRENRVSRWWQWTPSQDGTVEIAVNSQRMGIYTGQSLESLVKVVTRPTQDQPPRSRFSAQTGTTYWIQVGDDVGLGADFVLTMEQHEAPPNDLFDKRVELTGTSAAYEGDATRATLESGEELFDVYQRSNSVWWRWVAPRSAQLVLTLDSRFSTLGIYTGDSIAGLVLVGQSLYDTGFAVLPVIKGQEYVIRSTLDDPGPYALTLELVDPPVNDNFANRTTLTGESVVAEGQNRAATAEDGEGDREGKPAATSVWWKWAAPKSGRVTFGISGDGDREPVVEIYRGASLVELTSMRPPEYSRGPFTFETEAGVEYSIAIDGLGQQMGAFVFRIGVYDPPSNDALANPIVVDSADFPVNGSNLGATIENGERLGAYYGGSHASVWYRWTPEKSGRVYLSVDGSSSEAHFTVFPESLIHDFDRVCAGRNISLKEGPCFGAFDAAANVSYLIGVGSHPIHQGPFSLNLVYVDAPLNDDFSGRIRLEGSSVAVETDNFAAILENNEPWDLSSDGHTGASIWWKWKAPASGEVVLSTEDSSIPLVLLTAQMGEGSIGMSNLERLGTAPGTPNAPAEIRLSVEADTEYVIGIAGVDGRMGPIRLQIKMPTAPVARQVTPNIVVGERLELSAAMADPESSATYQWFHNGRAVPGATRSSLVLPVAQVFHSGAYGVRKTTESGSAMSQPIVVEVDASPSSPKAHLLNISTRALCLSGEGALIPGFVLNGEGKRLLIRAVGPKLGEFGVAGNLPDPQIELKRFVDGAFVPRDSNDDWNETIEGSRIAAVSEQVGAFALQAGSADSALLVDLSAGRYTVVAKDAQGRPGLAMVEIYDLSDPDGRGSLINLSNRGVIGSGANVMIPGFVIAGEGTKTLLFRAVGPGLAELGVRKTLPDPMIVVYRKNPETGKNEPILTCDDWGEYGDGAEITAVAQSIGAFPLIAGSKDSALVVRLPPGIYTAHAGGADGSEGVALVEIYEVP